MGPWTLELLDPWALGPLNFWTRGHAACQVLPECRDLWETNNASVHRSQHTQRASVAIAAQEQLLFLFVLSLSLSPSPAMKVLLTPVGANDKVIELIPRNCGLIPEQAHVNVVICGDGKLMALAANGATRPVFLDEYYTRLFTKLCKLGNEDVVRTVSVVETSFFDDDFHVKIGNADFFFMAGFTTGTPIVERIFRRDDQQMTLKRHAIANRIARNQMSYWGVCGSAVACGVSWDMPDFSSRVLPPQKFQMLEVLADGYVDYQAAVGAGGVRVTPDMAQWHITGGTGCVIVATPARQYGEAFVCVRGKKGGSYWGYLAACNEITAKMQSQIKRLNSCVSYFRSSPRLDARLWRICWGSGVAELSSEDAYQADDAIVV